MLGILFDPFSYSFMSRALWVLVIIAVPASLLSCYLVLKGWALIGDAITHAILPGVAVASILKMPLFLGAFMAAMTCTISTGFMARYSRVKNDTILGVVFSAMFALGLILITKFDIGVDIHNLIYGNIFGLSATDVSKIITSMGVVTFVICVKYKDLMVFIFDEIHAHTFHHNTYVLNYGLLALVSCVAVTSLMSTGLILSIAFFILPGATAYLLSIQFVIMLFIAVIYSLFSCYLGLLLSFYLDSAPSATITLIMFIIFLGIFMYREIFQGALLRMKSNDR